MSSRKSCILINLAVHDEASNNSSQFITSNDYSILRETTTTTTTSYSPLASPSNRLSFANPGLVLKSSNHDAADSSISSNSSSSSRITPIGQKPANKKQKDEMKNMTSRKSTSLEFLNDSSSSSSLSGHQHHLYYALNPAVANTALFSTVNQPQLRVPTINSNRVSIGKEPRPQRCLLILDSVISGLTLAIGDVRCKVADLSAAVANGYNAMTKQLLQSECYLRHLEQKVNILSKLHKSYTVYLKMNEGIQNMYEAYKSSPGNQMKNLASIKSGWRECIKTLCLIEAQIESLLGTFQFQIEKLIGFSRLCPGDTYEIQIKYGADASTSQSNSSHGSKSKGCKIKARARIGKDAVSQTWNRDSFALKITLDELIHLRINEIKFLGKNVLIGEQVCDTKDFFSTLQTQRLTVNANTSGTIKISMLITWLPFENCEDSFAYFNPTSQYLPSSTLLRQSNLNDTSSCSSTARPTSMIIADKEELKSDKLSNNTNTHENRSLCLSVSSSSASSNDDEFQKETAVHEIIEELVDQVASANLDEFEQAKSLYAELCRLLDHRELRVKLSSSVDSYFASQNNNDNSNNVSSVNLEDEVLKCFEFLNDEESSDCANESIESVFSESKHTTDLDLFLTAHFKYCIELKLNHLEQRARRLSKQNTSLIINKANYELILHRLDNEINFINLYIDQTTRSNDKRAFVDSIIGDNKENQDMWLQLADQSLLCCTNIPQAIQLLGKRYSDSSGHHDLLVTFLNRVFKGLQVLTLPHFVYMVNQLGRSSLLLAKSLCRRLSEPSEEQLADLAELFLLKSECYISLVEPLIDDLIKLDLSLLDEREKLLFYHNFGKLIQSEEVRSKLRSVLINKLVETDNDSLWDQHFEQLMNIF